MGRGKGDTAETSNLINKNHGVNLKHGTIFRKLSNEEIEDKIKKGLCFRCDEKLGPNHVCRNKQLHMLLIIEGDIWVYDKILDDKEGMKEEDEGERVLQLSMFTMASLTMKKSWKVWGKIGDMKVVWSC